MSPPPRWMAAWLLGGALLPVPCAAARTVELGSAEGDAPQRVQVGDELILRLFSNPSTGKHWRIDVTAAVKVLETVANGRRIDRSPERMVGSGGMYEWRFRAIAPGTATLRLERVEARAVPAPEAPVRVFSVVVSPPDP